MDDTWEPEQKTGRKVSTPKRQRVAELWDSYSREVLPKPDEIASARKVLEVQAAKDPAAAKWVFALGRAASIEADQAEGDAAKAKKKDAVARFEHAVEMQPGNADYEFWFGSASLPALLQSTDPGTPPLK